MPIYSVRCKKCGAEDEIYRSIADMDDLPNHCHRRMERTIGRTNLIADIKPYKSMITGEMITSRSHHREHLKRHNCFEIGNEVDAHLKAAKKPRIVDKERRKAQIADIVNGKL